MKSETEWILYDDDRLSFVQDNWTGVLHSCLENQACPTVLFYEKLVSQEEDAPYEPRREFSYVKLELSTLLRLAQQTDNASENAGFASKRMVEEQKAIEKQIRADRIERKLRTYELFWTTDVTRSNYESNHITCQTHSEANRQFHEIRVKQRR